MEKKRFIVIEGACDGIGKTTQYKLLKKHLEDEKEQVVSHHFPSYGTYQGVPVEKYLRGEYGSIYDLSPYFINSLYAIDRAITWITELKKSYLEGKTILLDRYTTSSLIYQSSIIEDKIERKKFIDYVMDFEYRKIGLKEPDIVLFLYAPFDLVTKFREKRRENEGIQNDIHEKNLEYMKKVYDNALFIADYLSWEKIDCSFNQEMKTIEEIHENIYERVRKKIIK